MAKNHWQELQRSNEELGMMMTPNLLLRVGPANAFPLPRRFPFSAHWCCAQNAKMLKCINAQHQWAEERHGVAKEKHWQDLHKEQGRRLK